MKKMFVNFMAIIGVFSVLVAIGFVALTVKDRFDEKKSIRESNEYVYTQVDEFIEDIHGDRSITIERQSDGTYKLTHNNGYKDHKYEFVRKDGTIDTYSK